MTEIKIKDQLLYLPKFAAGEKLIAKLHASAIAENARLFLIIANKNTDKTYALSQELNYENNFTAEINLMTTGVFEDFSQAKSDYRCWVIVEVFDIANQQSIAKGYTIIQNSVLVTGSDPANIPGVSSVLTKSDFDDIDFSKTNSLDEVAETLYAVGEKLKDPAQ